MEPFQNNSTLKSMLRFCFLWFLAFWILVGTRELGMDGEICCVIALFAGRFGLQPPSVLIWLL